MLDFKRFEISAVNPVRRANVSQQVKFRADWSKCCGDMADFQFFKMAAVRHLGFVLRVFRPPTKSICWSLSLCKIWLESVQ